MNKLDKILNESNPLNDVNLDSLKELWGKIYDGFPNITELDPDMADLIISTDILVSLIDQRDLDIIKDFYINNSDEIKNGKYSDADIECIYKIIAIIRLFASQLSFSFNVLDDYIKVLERNENVGKSMLN